MDLRPYQTGTVTKIKEQFAAGCNRIVVCAPTGAGKTVIFSEISKLVYNAGKSVLIITNRKELCSQTNNKLQDFYLIPDILNANQKERPESRVVVSMVETLNRRLSKSDYLGFIQRFDLIIIDECHIHSFDKIFSCMTEKQRVLGFSATPYRKSIEKPLKNYYDTIITVCQVGELVADGFLARPISYGVPLSLAGLKMKGGDYDEQEMGKVYDDSVKYTGAIANYEKYAKNKKTIIFCATIQNSKFLTQMFFDSGYNAKHFDCYMLDSERKNVLDWFYSTNDAILCNVGILTTGFDCPEIECVLIYRATKMLPLFLQMVGRGSRVTPEKKDFTVLDFGNNCATHGLWEIDRSWSLEPPKKRSNKKDAPMIKECTACHAYIPINIKICPECGFIPIVKKKEKTEIEILLERLTPSETQRLANSGTLTIEELEQVRELKGYKVGWVLFKLETLEQFKEYSKIKNYKNGWAEYQWKIRTSDSE